MLQLICPASLDSMLSLHCKDFAILHGCTSAHIKSRLVPSCVERLSCLEMSGWMEYYFYHHGEFFFVEYQAEKQVHVSERIKS